MKNLEMSIIILIFAPEPKVRLSDKIMEESSSYRPHDPGHDYYAPGIYLITLVVRNRRDGACKFGSLNDDIRQPQMVSNDLGKAVMECWEEIPAFEESKGRKVAVHAAVCMPDHFHGVIEVKERMTVSVGQVIWGFKVACTKRYRSLQPKTASKEPVAASKEPMAAVTAWQPSLVASTIASAPVPASSAPVPNLHHMSKKQRAEYYATHPEAQQPLWDDNYDDTICLSDPVTGAYSQRHFVAMVRYVNDNARRAIVRRLRPEYMRLCLHMRIGGRDYAAFGNFFLLRWARKEQVFCHRKARLWQLSDEERQRYGYSRVYNAAGSIVNNADMTTRIPYEETEAYRKECNGWATKVLAGATVIVTPGISRGEQLMKEQCLEKGWPLIHLQKEPIGQYWKPEERRFNACCSGSLLILAPWKAEELGEVNGVPSGADYSMFHNLNTLAEEICLFDGDAEIIGGIGR